MSPVSRFIAQRPWLHCALYVAMFTLLSDAHSLFGKLLFGLVLAALAYAFFRFASTTTWSTLEFHIGRSALVRRAGDWMGAPRRSRPADRLALWVSAFALVAVGIPVFFGLCWLAVRAYTIGIVLAGRL